MKIINIDSIIAGNFTSRIYPADTFYVYKGLCRYTFAGALTKTAKDWN